MEIRQLGEGDAPAYRDLRLRGLREDPEAFGTTYDGEIARPLAFTVDRLRAQSASDGRFTLGAFDGALIGVVTVLREESAKMRHRASLVGMYVAPEARKHGVGRALAEAACARAAQVVGLEQIHLAVVTPNVAAQQLYRTMNFVTYGIEPRALKLGGRYWDEELMVRRLHPS